jgi:hypothetical protein
MRLNIKTPVMSKGLTRGEGTVLLTARNYGSFTTVEISSFGGEKQGRSVDILMTDFYIP